MTKTVVDDAHVVAVLDAIKDRSEICDSQGRVLGVYVPQSVEQIVYYKGAKSPYSREELERRFREGADNAKPLSEFWAEMRVKHPDKFE